MQHYYWIFILIVAIFFSIPCDAQYGHNRSRNGKYQTSYSTGKRQSPKARIITCPKCKGKKKDCIICLEYGKVEIINVRCPRKYCGCRHYTSVPGGTRNVCTTCVNNGCNAPFSEHR